jgi:hypothetical protein
MRLIQSQAPDSGLAGQRLSVRDSNLCPNPGLVRRTSRR